MSVILNFDRWSWCWNFCATFQIYYQSHQLQQLFGDLFQSQASYDCLSNIMHSKKGCSGFSFPIILERNTSMHRAKPSTHSASDSVPTLSQRWKSIYSNGATSRMFIHRGQEIFWSVFYSRVTTCILSILWSGSFY